MSKDIKNVKSSLECLKKVREFLVEYNSRNDISFLHVCEHDMNMVITDFEKELERIKKKQASLV